MKADNAVYLDLNFGSIVNFKPELFVLLQVVLVYFLGYLPVSVQPSKGATSSWRYRCIIRHLTTVWRNFWTGDQSTHAGLILPDEAAEEGAFTIGLVLFELRSMTLYSNQLVQDEWSMLDSQFTYKSHNLPQHRQRSPTMQVGIYSARTLTSLKDMVSQCLIPRFPLPLPPISLPISRASLDTCLGPQDYWYE